MWNLIDKQIVLLFITVTMFKANRFDDIYKDNYNDGIKQEDDCYKVLLNWCTLNTQNIMPNIGQKVTNKQQTTWRDVYA